MIYLLISILCSVSVGVLFKQIKTRTSVNIFLITINYLCAIIATWVCFQPQIQLSSFALDPYSMALSILLPVVFIILSLSLRDSGIIRTDIAQRISLIIPIACSYWIFNENISALKWSGLLTGFLAVIFILNKRQSTASRNSVYLLLVFLGYGIIDVLFKLVALQKAVPYTTALLYIFCGSFLFSCLITIVSIIRKKVVLEKSHIFYGILLGIFNFLNIYFYLKAHRHFADHPTTVFASMNFGVIFLGALVGSVYFKEKLSIKNIIGLILAVVAIICIIISQLNK